MKINIIFVELNTHFRKICTELSIYSKDFEAVYKFESIGVELASRLNLFGSDHRSCIAEFVLYNKFGYTEQILKVLS